MIFTTSFVCVALFAVAQGAAVGQIEDIAFEFEGQEFHLSPIEKRQANTSEVGANLNNKNTNSNNNNNNNNAQVSLKFFAPNGFILIFFL
jgi:hypothetical protein